MIPGIWHCQFFAVNPTLFALGKQGVCKKENRKVIKNVNEESKWVGLHDKRQLQTLNFERLLNSVIASSPEVPNVTAQRTFSRDKIRLTSQKKKLI